MLTMIGLAPHPPIIIPEIGRDRLGEAEKTVQGMKELSRQMKEAEPEILMLITPHGRIVKEGPAIQTGSELRGDFGQFGFPAIKISLKTDKELVDLIVEESANEDLQPLLIEDNGPFPGGGGSLDHGAMVPLFYLQQSGLNIPGIHITFSFHPLEQLYNFGRTLKAAVERRGKKVAVIASGDLSHRLTRGAPAGYNPRGADFDRKLVEYIRDGKVDKILNFDRQLIEEAGECGLRSFVMALGMLDRENLIPEIISYEGPFGVGYLVATLRQGGR